MLLSDSHLIRDKVGKFVQNTRLKAKLQAKKSIDALRSSLTQSTKVESLKPNLTHVRVQSRDIESPRNILDTPERMDERLTKTQ